MLEATVTAPVVGVMVNGFPLDVPEAAVDTLDTAPDAGDPQAHPPVPSATITLEAAPVDPVLSCIAVNTPV